LLGQKRASVAPTNRFFGGRTGMLGRMGWTMALLGALAADPAWSGDAKYSIKQADTPAPPELSEPIRKLLAARSLQLLDDKGAVICELWFRAALPVKATPEQLKNGLTYREAEESTVLGAVR